MTKAITPAQRKQLERVAELERAASLADERMRYQRRQILTALNAEGLPLRTLADELGIHFTRVRQIIRGE